MLIIKKKTAKIVLGLIIFTFSIFFGGVFYELLTGLSQ